MENNNNGSIITFRGTKWLLLFVFYLQFLVAEVVKMNWSFFYSGEVPAFVLIFCTQVFAVALPCVVFLFINSTRPSEILKLNKIRPGVALVCVLIGISAQPIASLCNAPMLWFLDKYLGGMPQPVVNTAESGGALALGIIIVALMPAIFEEILMRGIVLYSTERSGYRFTIFITSFLFALLHNDITNFLGVFFLGIVVCYVVWMTQSIYAGIITHFAFNSFGYLLDFFIKGHGSEIPWLTGSVFNTTLIVISVFVFGCTTSLIVRKKVKRYKTHFFFKQLLSTIFSLPIILIILGYFMFGLLQWLTM